MRTPFDHLWNYNDPAGTAARFEAFKNEIEDDLNLTLQLMTQIARTYGLRQRFAEAHEILDEVAHNLSLDPDFDLVWVRLWLERGRTYNSSGEKKLARPLFLLAYERAVACKADFYAVDAAHMMGIIEPPAEQFRWNELAISAAEQSADEEANGWLGSLYNNLGWSYHEAGSFERALNTFQKGLRWQEKHKPGQEMEYIARWTVGRALRSLGRIDEALTIQHQLEAHYAAKNNPGGYVFEELGELYLITGNRQKAASYFEKAYEILSKDPWLQKNEVERLDRIKAISLG